MAVYEYQAISASGKNTKGVIDADTPAAARRKLREQNLFPTRIVESFSREQNAVASKSSRGRGRISSRDVALLTRQLAVLLNAGMPLTGALSALIEQTPNARLGRVLYSIRDKVNEGVRLADALAAHPRIFPELYINMVSAGESSGALEQVLFRLADILDRNVKLNRRVLNSLAYPAFMAVVGTSVITFLMLVIVPKITRMFIQQGRTLPLVTRMLIGLCSFITHYWFILIFIVVSLFGLWRFWVSRPAGRLSWDRFKLRVPLLGDLYVRIIASRFARTLGTMLSSNLTMMTSLDVVKSVVQNKLVEDGLDDVKAGVRRGRGLAAMLREQGIFPPMMISMIELGQNSGELEDMLIKVADIYDDEVESHVDTLVSLLEPVMILIMALFVGFLVVAILLPIFDMSSGI